MLVREISAIHNMKVGNINQRMNDNRNRFKDGVDLLDLKVTDSNGYNLEDLGLTKMQIAKSKNIYLLSERGYAKLIKIWRSDLYDEITN